MSEPNELEKKIERLRADLKDALDEIEARGRTIGALKSLAAGLFAVVDELVKPSDAVDPSLIALARAELAKKITRLRREALPLEVQ